MVLSWQQGKWIQLSYIHHLGYVCGYYGFVESLEEFKEQMIQYKISFAEVIDISINGQKHKARNVKAWFPDPSFSKDGNHV